MFAGKACSADFFVTSYENTQVHAVLGKYAQDKGFKRAFLMAPNYQAGKDSVAGFKSMFTGEIVEEDFVPLTQLDFQADLARIAAAKPDVIFAFMPGGLGVALVKQFHQSGLAEKIPFLSAFTVDESTLPAEQDAALGLFGGMTWAPNMDNAANQTSSPATGGHHKVPGSYAMQGYDAAQVIDAALKQTGGATGGQGEAARGTSSRRFCLPAWGVPLQHQWLSDPGFLPRQGGEAAGRAVPDRDRAKSVLATTPTALPRTVRCTRAFADQAGGRGGFRCPAGCCWSRR